MAFRPRHTEGFTLAELLLAVSIVLVLCAVALPSIVATQNNLRVFELDSAAESIADAAQAQMTAKKSGGTWTALVKDDAGYKADFPAAVSSDARTDLRYMDADAARANGIITPLAIDQGVYEGAYIIEFDASTASVTRVFYTDGKTGFFGAPSDQSAVLASYYADFGAQADSVARRMASKPMVGLFEGTAAGATEAKALDSPVIWMDSAGSLCVQDKNLTGQSAWGTELSVTVSRKGSSASGVTSALAPTFTISGLSGSYTSCTIAATGADGTTYSGTFTKAELLNIIKTTSREQTPAQTNVYAIDLNQLVATVAGDEARQALHAILAEFVPHEDLQVDAKASIPASKKLGYVPATAKAYVQWPAKQAKVYLFATNPQPASGAAHIKGAYVAPSTGLSGADVQGIWKSQPDIAFPVDTKSAVLTSENPESAQQKYSGGFAVLSEAVGKKATIQATAGSYAPAGATTAHQYQIYEIWLSVSNEEASGEVGATTASDFQRVGYLKENEWAWEATDWGNRFSQCVQLSGNATGTTAYTKVEVDSQELYRLLPVSEESSGYQIYVRTTPKLEEVGSWFSGNMTSGFSFSTSVTTPTTGSRGTNYGYIIRQPFENEFGAPTTVALWQFTKAAGKSVKLSNGSGYPAANDIRVYYTATPAVAWGAGTFIDDTVTNALPSAALWLYKKSGADYDEQPMALVRPSRTAGENYHLVKSPTADFEFDYGSDGYPGHDELFYRVFQYCDEEGTPLDGFDVAYVPYLSQGQDYAKFKSATKSGNLFKGWTVYAKGQPVLDASGNPLVVEEGKTPADYDELLPLGSIQLLAQFEPFDTSKAAGLVYVGLNASGQKVAYGFQSGEGAAAASYAMDDWLGPEAEVGSYYLAVPSNILFWLIGEDYSVGTCSGSAFDAENCPHLTLGGQYMKLYRLTAAQTQGDFTRIVYSVNDRLDTTRFSREYYVNFNFARAVEADAARATQWGTSEASPWQVELPKQFPGALDATLQRAYLDDCFLQTRDIDFAGAVYGGIAGTFSGVYDGADHALASAENVLGSLKFDSRYPGQTNGLFPYVDGATLKSLNVVFGSGASGGAAAPSITYDDANNPVIYFGSLAGYVRNGVISGCTAGAYGGAATVSLHSLRHEFGAAQESYNAAGGLVARTLGATSVVDSGVSDLTFSLQTDDDTWASNQSRNYFGGLVGVADVSGFAASDKPLSNLSVSNVSLNVGQSTLAAEQNVTLGGLAGRVWTGSRAFSIDSSWDWSISDVSIAVDLGLDRRGVSERLFVGSAIGNLVGSQGVSASCEGFGTSGCAFENKVAGGATYVRDLSAHGPLRGPIPLTDDWAYEPAGLLYLAGATGAGDWDAYGYLAGDALAAATTIAKESGDAGALEAGAYYLAMPAGRGVESTDVVIATKLAGTYLVGGESRELYLLSAANETGSRYVQAKLPVTGGIDLPTTHAYFVNFNFANAVETDETAAQAWGTAASPWQVALAKQFPGAQPSVVQKARLGDEYRQIVDLDMSDLATTPQFAGAFSGVYDGGGFAIAQFHDGMSTFVNVLNGSQDVSLGLFPWVRGGTLRNVSLSLEQRDAQPMQVDLPSLWSKDDKKRNGLTAIGCLAGYVQSGSVVQNCSVGGLPTGGESIVDLTVANNPEITSQVGALVGYAASSTIMGCATSDLRLNLGFASYAVELSNRNNGCNQVISYLNIGGVVGCADGLIATRSVLSRISSSHIEFTADAKVQSRWARMGGVLGVANAATTLTDSVGDQSRTQTQAVDVLVTYATGQVASKVRDTAGGLVGRLNAGGLSEQSIVVDIDVRDNYDKDTDNVRYRLGSGAAEVFCAKWYGNDGGVIEPDLAALSTQEEPSVQDETSSVDEAASKPKNEKDAVKSGSETSPTSPTDPADPADPSDGGQSGDPAGSADKTGEPGEAANPDEPEGSATGEQAPASSGMVGQAFAIASRGGVVDVA